MNETVCREVFTNFYHKLSCIMNVEHIAAELVTQGIINFSQEQEIASINEVRQKAMYVLRIISASLDGGVTQSFEKLLEILGRNRGDAALLANEIIKELTAGGMSLHTQIVLYALNSLSSKYAVIYKQPGLTKRIFYFSISRAYHAVR